MNKGNRPEKVIGWREWMSLPDLNIPAIKSKIDTGARTSSLHTIDLEEFYANDILKVRFVVRPLRKRKEFELHCEAAVLDYKNVRDSGGHTEERYFIQTTAVLGGAHWCIDITLTNRDTMLFPMLLGRTALKDRFIVDPGRSYTTGRRLSKAYSRR
jgi:hypothetical protein